MENETITTQTQKVWVDKDGIIRNTVLPNAEITLAEAKIVVQAIIKITKGKRSPIFVDSRQIKIMTREARQYLASEESTRILSAIAVLVASPISKIIGKFFINFSKPFMPTQLFTNKNDALAWLKEFLK